MNLTRQFVQNSVCVCVCVCVLRVCVRVCVCVCVCVHHIDSSPYLRPRRPTLDWRCVGFVTVQMQLFFSRYFRGIYVCLNRRGFFSL